ncbi:PhzF family phenazine biosynthesis protein [Effusibacillus pohliae]|uniref:PhzF family phenazine biosynthesis protein n=1 Tax=Effusibacillus pohliae TaxID=232270 RepID=UPI00037B20A3|nr:PhzF family phenazine biosynthesis protein [Effusibacillus pohliae]
MHRLPFFIVDVFAEAKYAGNQLAVFRGAGGLSTAEMQKIAREMNYSETTFLLSDEQQNGGYDVRIFTPEEEVPFAGHPTLGTAFVIQREIAGKAADTIVLNLRVGQIPVTFGGAGGENDLLWMKQNQPVFGETVDPQRIAKVLSIEEEDIDHRFPVQEVSTGLPSLIVPLNSLDAVKRSRTNRDEYFALVDKLQAKAILVFCPETYSSQNQVNARVFGDYFGVPEDPATGSANGNLAGYLVKHRYFGRTQIDLRVEQGYEIGRPSLLYLRAEEKAAGIEVSVGGHVVMVAKGEFV